jgi:hypothetical protein
VDQTDSDSRGVPEPSEHLDGPRSGVSGALIVAMVMCEHRNPSDDVGKDKRIEAFGMVV